MQPTQENMIEGYIVIQIILFILVLLVLLLLPLLPPSTAFCPHSSVSYDPPSCTVLYTPSSDS